jgi:hypothetical protein
MFKRKAGGSKYGAIKTEVDGHRFDSKIESKYYTYLKELESEGRIKDLSLQPTFTLMEGFRRNGVKIRDIVYRADFKYWDIQKERLVIADVKGSPDSTYKLKAKLFLQYLQRFDEDTLFHEVYWKAKQWEVIER